MRWDYLRQPEFEEAISKSKGVCVVPIGCIERHGPHTPLGTDTIIAENLCIEAAKKEPVVVFPTMYFGEKSGSGNIRGTVIFSLSTRWAIFRETCNEIYRNGFNKILFMNSHGGNSSMLGAFVRAMAEENPNVLVFSTSTAGRKYSEKVAHIAENRDLYPYLTDKDLSDMQYIADNKLGGGGHAGLIETSFAYHYAPEYCDLSLIESESGSSNHRFDVLSNNKLSSPLAWGAEFPNSYDATNKYSEYFNERIARAICDEGINALAERYKVLKEETVSTEYHKEWLEAQIKNN